MAQDKKGFILYADQIDLFTQLPNDKAGKLIKHIFAYVNDEDPQTDDLIINIAFTPIKNQFKRDLEKWQTTREGRSKAGKASAEARRLKKEQESTNSTNVKSVEQNPTNPTVNDNDNVNVTVNVKDKVTNNNIIRETEFKNSLQPFLKEFGKDILNKFYLYWTEKKPKGRKMRFEMEKTFDIKRRLDRWSNNNFNKKEKSCAKKEDAAIILQRQMGIIK